MPFTSSSRQCIFINTGPPNERTILVRPSKDLEELPDESEDIAESTLLDHYAKRAVDLSSVCLADFAALYDYVKRGTEPEGEPNNEEATGDIDPEANSHPTQRVTAPRFKQQFESGVMVRRYKSKIIRCRRYGKAQDPDNYYREQCMLYMPWRDETADILNHISEGLYQENQIVIQANRQKYDPKHKPDDVDDLFRTAEDEDDGPEDLVSSIVQEDYSQDIFNTMSNSKKSDRIDFINSPKLCSDEEYLHTIRTLNDGQRKYLLNLMHRFKFEHQPEVYDFIMGGAGVGKSHLVTAIVQTLIRVKLRQPGIRPDNVIVLVCAATGKAAHNVRGITLHCAFKLPPNQYGGTLARLNDDMCNSLTVKLKDLQLVIIDEVSMMSSKQLNQIDARLQQIFANSKPLGGVPLLAVGDLRQIRPFGGRFVFECTSSSLSDLIAGNVLWQKFKMFELTEIMRQKDDLRFAQALNRLADGAMTKDDILLFKSRIITPSLQPPTSAIRLYGSNKDCGEYNDSVHQTLSTEEAMSVAFDRIQGTCTDEQRGFLLSYVKSLPTKDTDGLPNEVLLKVGAIYMISLNVDVSDGLFNGSTGVLQQIFYGVRTGVRIPIRVLIEFSDAFVGASARASFHPLHPSNMSWTPVGLFQKVKIKFVLFNFFVFLDL
jgi:DNA replication protein DnaC